MSASRFSVLLRSSLIWIRELTPVEKFQLIFRAPTGVPRDAVQSKKPQGIRDGTRGSSFNVVELINRLETVRFHAELSRFWSEPL